MSYSPWPAYPGADGVLAAHRAGDEAMANPHGREAENGRFSQEEPSGDRTSLHLTQVYQTPLSR